MIIFIDSFRLQTTSYTSLHFLNSINFLIVFFWLPVLISNCKGCKTLTNIKKLFHWHTMLEVSFRFLMVIVAFNVFENILIKLAFSIAFQRSLIIFCSKKFLDFHSGINNCKPKSKPNIGQAGKKFGQKFGLTCSSMLWNFFTMFFVVTWEKKQEWKFSAS